MTKIKIKVPSTLEDITVREFIEYSQIEDPTESDVLRCFGGVPSGVEAFVSQKDSDRLLARITDLLNTRTGLIEVFELKGKRFGFEPSLDQASIGIIKDATKYLQDPTQANRALAVLYRPVTSGRSKMRLIEDYEGSDKYAEDMLDAPLNIYFGMVVFFYNLTNDLLSYTLKSTKQEDKRTRLTIELLSLLAEGFSRSGAIITNSSRSQEMTL